MNTEAIVHHLREWVNVHAQIRAAADDLIALTGSDIEAKLPMALWAGFEAYTRLLADVVGDTHNEWLSWYCWENDMGAKKMGAGPVGSLRPICTVEDLAWLITL